MNYLKKFIMGGLLLLFINFIIINILTLYYDMSQIDVNIKMKLFNTPLLSIERSSNEFGYVFMGRGMLLSILTGGVITLIIDIIIRHKRKFSDS